MFTVFIVGKYLAIVIAFIGFVFFYLYAFDHIVGHWSKDSTNSTLILFINSCVGNIYFFKLNIFVADIAKYGNMSTVSRKTIAVYCRPIFGFTT